MWSAAELLGCARFSEFWLFFTEQVFTLPLYCYEKGNQSAMNLDTKQQNEHTPGFCQFAK